MKVVINRCFGGFGLSAAALRRYAELKGFSIFFYTQTKYEHREGVTEYKRVEDGDSVLSHALKNDLGPVCGSEEFNAAEMVDTYDLERNDPILVQIVEELGEVANGQFAEFKIVEIPDDVKWEIEEYDGQEHVAEVHRTW